MADTPTPETSDVQDAETQANALMQQGIALLADGRPEAPSEALACFDKALAIREGLAADAAPMVTFGVATSWLSRADALRLLGGLPQLAEAVRSCDQGIQLLRALPLGEDARYPRCLALAHLNRGMLLQAQGRPVADAVTDLDQAIAVLQSDEAATIEDRPYLLSVLWTNLANACIVDGSADGASRARTAAKQALEMVAEVEAEIPAAAEVGLKARHTMCRSFAQQLQSAQAAGTAAPPDDVHDATDVVDEGLALARRWEQRGLGAFRGIAADLFRFGLQLYLVFQPQFLQEFLDENLDPANSSEGFARDPEMTSAAQEIVDLHARIYADPSTS